MSLIEIKNLHKAYKNGDSELRALDGVSININEGESVAITGKSGSGKSTLMHIMALLDKPTVGKVIIDGENQERLKSHQINEIRNKMFGFVFQQFFMNSRDTVLENVLSPLKIGKVKRSERKAIALKALEQVELLDKANSLAGDLSGGQKQRVCIARALVNNPRVIFADEPTGNLDSTTGKKIEDILFDLNKQGITLIIVTHDEELAAKCGRKIVIKDGKIIQDTNKPVNKKGAK